MWCEGDKTGYQNKERLTVPVRCQELVLVGHDALEGHFLHVGIGMLQELTEKTDTNDMGEYIYITDALSVKPRACMCVSMLMCLDMHACQHMCIHTYTFTCACV